MAGTNESESPSLLSVVPDIPGRVASFLASLSPLERAYADLHPATDNPFFYSNALEYLPSWEAGIKNQQNLDAFARKLSGATLTNLEQFAVDHPNYAGTNDTRGSGNPYQGVADPYSLDGGPDASLAEYAKYGLTTADYSKAASEWAAFNTAAAQSRRADAGGGLGTLGTLALLAAAIYTGGAAAGYWGAAEAAGGAAAFGAAEGAALGSGITYTGATAAAIGEGALGAGITYSGATAASIGGGALGAGITGSGITSATLAGYAATATASAAELAGGASWFENAKSAYNIASKANTVKNAVTGGSSAQKFTGALGGIAPAAAATSLLTAPAAAGVATAAGAAAAAAAVTGATGAGYQSSAQGVALNPQLILALMLLAGTFFIFKGVKHG